MPKRAHLLFELVFLLAVGSVSCLADEISDTLTVSDTMGVYSIPPSMLFETQEPGTIVINVPQVTVPFGREGNAFSDSIEISPFMVSLSSTSGTASDSDVGESTTNTITISAVSQDFRTPSGISASDTLEVTLNGRKFTRTINEDMQQEQAFVELGATQARPLGGDGGDTFHMDALTITLRSMERGAEPPGKESWSDTITITADSSVPEPSTLGLLGIGLAGLMAFRRQRS